MAQLQIDLSGTKGLALRYYGNKPYLNAEPNKIYYGTDGQIASGTYNPISQLGYLSPANNTTKAVTGTTSFLLTSSITVPRQLAFTGANSIYFADAATTGTSGQIVNLDTAIDTSLDATYTIPTFTVITFRANVTAVDDTFTLVSGNLTSLGLASASAVKFLSSTSGGLTLNTTYYLGDLTTTTFRVYSDVGLTTLIDVTSNRTNLLFEIALGSTMYSRSDDFALYEINGVQNIFFTRENTTNAGGGSSGRTIGISDTDFSSPTPTWSATSASGGNYGILASGGRIRFVLADNNFLYVLNANTLHKIDGSTAAGNNGTITASVLTFVGDAQQRITRLIDAIDIKGLMWFGLHVNAAFDTFTNSIDSMSFPMFVGVYVWDRQTTTVNGTQTFIPITGVKELKSMHKFQGAASCFTISTDGYTEFRMWDGNKMKIMQRLGKNAYPAYGKHSLHEMDEYITWLGNDGKIYSYGIFETGLTNALHILGDVTSHITAATTYTAAGVFVPANATETTTTGTQTGPLAYYLSFSDSGGNHLQKWYPHSVSTVASNAQVAHQGDVYTLVKYLPTMSNLKSIDIVCLPNGTSGDTTTVATVKLYANQSITPWATKVITRNDISKGYISYELNKNYVTAFQMEIEWDTTQTLGPNDFNPAYAVIEYEPTRTR